MLSRRSVLAGLALVPGLRWSVLGSSAQADALPPIVGEGSIAVACLNLNTLKLAGLTRPSGATQPTDPKHELWVRGADARLGALKQAGATRLYLLLDLEDFLGSPVLAVPLDPGADPERIKAELIQGLPGLVIAQAQGEVIRGLVIVGQPAALTRIRNTQPADRADLQAALNLSDPAAPIRVAISPGVALRRSIEETLPTIGGEPITSLTQGMSWAALVLPSALRPARATIQATGPAAAQALAQLARLGIEALTRPAGPEDQAAAALGAAIKPVRVAVEGDQVVADLTPATVAALVAIPLGQVREATQRSQSVQNLKNFGLAMHNYHSDHGTFPPAYRADPAGRPLLSWRVLILPFLDELALYNEFHLDEPWDSPHNKPLIARMPRVLASPLGPELLQAEGKTTYLTPRGPQTMFPGATPVSLKQVTDGTSQTIMILEADDSAATIWTKPDDWEVEAPWVPVRCQEPADDIWGTVRPDGSSPESNPKCSTPC